MRALALVSTAVASLGLLVSVLVGGRVAELCFAVLAVLFPGLLMALGAARRPGRSRAVFWLIGALVLLFEGCLAGMLLARGQVQTGAWFLGLPAAAAFQIYGLFLAPQLLVALGYALTFESFSVHDDELERLRELARRRPEG